MMTEKDGSAPWRDLSPTVEEEHGVQQHCKEGDTSVWEDEDKDEKYNIRNKSKRLHTQKNDCLRRCKINIEGPSIKKAQNPKTLHIGIHPLVYLDRWSLFNGENIGQIEH